MSTRKPGEIKIKLLILIFFSNRLIVLVKLLFTFYVSCVFNMVKMTLNVAKMTFV